MPTATRTSPASRLHRFSVDGCHWLCQCITLLAFLTVSGCLGARGDIEVVEARLRQQQDLLSRYERDLMTVERERDEARHDAQLLRTQLADAGNQALPSEFTRSLFEIRGIEFNSLMTGGRDRDGQPGDDVLVAVFVPRDEHGDVVKLPGAIELEAVDLSRPESERQIGKWKFTTEESRKLWKSGAFSSGFQVVVPLPETASGEKLILHARLATADGREFDATHTVSVKPGNRVAGAAPATSPARGQLPQAPPAETQPDAPGRAVISPVAHEEIKPMSKPRTPRPTTEPLATQPTSPLVPIPSDDAFTPPAEDAGDPFADAPADANESVKPAGADPTAKEAGPRPFPSGPKTSDNFTDETIPFVR